MKVYLDGNPIQYPNDTLLEPRFTERRKNEEGQFAISFTGELMFTGTDFDYVYSKLVTDPQAINNSIILLFVDDCCENKEYRFLIKPESLKWCDGSCEITANAVEFTPDSQAYACLENTLIWDNYNGFKSASHPKVKYCLEYRPSLMQDALLIIGLFTVFGATTILAMFATILLPLIGLINAVVAFVNGLGASLNSITIGGFSDPIAIFNYLKNLFETTNGQLIAGCGYEHPSPLVRSYLSNVCNKCGIGIESSIFNDPTNDYYNLIYFSAPIKSGRINNPYFVKPIVPFIDDNQPIHNGKTFVEEIIQPFNGKYDINNGVLRIHRRDFFENQIPFFDATTYDPNKIIRQCYEWSKKRRPAYADIGYQKDAIDWCGSEATSRWSDIIEWNNPVNPIQKGAHTKLFPYSAARFRDDKIERDVLSDYSWMPYGIGQAIQDNSNAMIMNSGTSFTPKLLIWDGADINNATIARNYGDKGYGPNASVNYPMWVDANLSGNLYDRYWFIDNPRNANFSGYDYTIEVVWDCTLLNSVDINGTIKTSKGLSKSIDSIEYDYSRSVLIFKGTV